MRRLHDRPTDFLGPVCGGFMTDRPTSLVAVHTQTPFMVQYRSIIFRGFASYYIAMAARDSLRNCWLEMRA